MYFTKESIMKLWKQLFC